ncbi:MAG: LuxR C-terminal-related transcriptional regulator [Acidimicrobiales bacterium]
MTRVITGLTDPDPSRGPELTSREVEVLTLVLRTCTVRTIARDLFISENSARNHLRSIGEKLGLSV